jgi:long-subunit fatty acid transport protein
VLVVLALLPGSTWAVTDEEIFRDFRFNFTNPGARALGLGGAFIAAADDATAAQANPAALHYVYRKEIFFEYRLVTSDDQVFDASTGGDINDVTSSDLFFELTSVTHREDVSFPSFLSFALPFNIGSGRATFAFSRQVVLKTEATLEGDDGQTTGLRLSGSGYPTWINDGSQSCAPNDGGLFQRYSVCNTVSGGLDAELVHYNLSFAYSITKDFSIGLTATYATLDVQSDVTNLTDDPLAVIDTSTNPRVNPGGGFEDIQQRNTIDDSDTGTAYTIGLHWHPDMVYPSGLSPWRFGLVYRKGADLAVDQVRENIDPTTGLPNMSATVPVTLREPDRYGIGFAYDAIEEKWVFALDIERVQYTDLLKGYESGVNFLTNQEQLQDLLPDYVFGEFRFTVDDATVVHAGVEYRLGTSWNWALRAGYYNAPDNRIRLEDVDVSLAPGATPPQTPEQIESVFKEAFSGGDDVNHFTAGFSFQAPGNVTFQFAGDLSEDETEFVMSAIWRFGKGRS